MASAPAPPAIRVVLADDERLIRASVGAVLAADPGFTVAGEADDGAQALDLVRAERPDIALLDVQMPGTGGLEAAEAIRSECPETATVILTTFQEDAYIARALDGGASGFVLKTGPPAALTAGLRAVAAGGVYLSPEIAHRIAAEVRSTGRMAHGAAARDRIGRLSAREREVLAHIGAGLSTAAIARRLGVATGTAKVHTAAVLAGLGVDNRVQAAVLAYEAGLVQPSGGA